MTDTDQTNSGENPPNGDQERNEPTAVELAEREERTVLMNRARMMGLTISNNIGLEKLREKIKDAQEGKKETPVVAPPPMVDPTSTGRKYNQRERMRLEATRLIRCQTEEHRLSRYLAPDEEGEGRTKKGMSLPRP